MLQRGKIGVLRAILTMFTKKQLRQKSVTDLLNCANKQPNRKALDNAITTLSVSLSALINVMSPMTPLMILSFVVPSIFSNFYFSSF